MVRTRVRGLVVPRAGVVLLELAHCIEVTLNEVLEEVDHVLSPFGFRLQISRYTPKNWRHRKMATLLFLLVIRQFMATISTIHHPKELRGMP